MFLPLYQTDYLIGLAFWAFPIGLKCVAWSGIKSDQYDTRFNGPWAFLLTLDKSKFIINYI